MAKSAITTYGEALFQIAVESSSCLQMLDEVLELKKILSENPELGSVMLNPRFSKEEHSEIISNVFKGRIDDKLFSFLELLVSKGRYNYLEEILDYFVSRVNRRIVEMEAHVTSVVLKLTGRVK